MACARSRSLRWAPSASGAAAALIVFLFISTAAAQRAYVYSPAVVTAHDPPPADQVQDAAPSVASPAAATAYRGPSAGATAAAGPSASAQPAALRINDGRSDNDVHFQQTSSLPPQQASNVSLPAQMADTQISNATAPVPSPATGAPAAVSSSVSPLSSTSAPSPPKDDAISSSVSPVYNVDIVDSATDVSAVSNADAKAVPDAIAPPGSALNASNTFNISAVSSATNTSRGNSPTIRRLDPNTSKNSVSSNTTVHPKQENNSFKNEPKPDKNKGVPYYTDSVSTPGSVNNEYSSETFIPVQIVKDAEDETTVYTEEITTDEAEDVTTDSPTTIEDQSEHSDQATTNGRVDESDGGAYPGANASAAGAHPCARECVEGAPPMRCVYRFELTGYYAMSKACYDCPRRAADCDLPDCVAADGVPRGVAVVNRQLPGPAVEVCLGDRVIVDLHNGMVAETTSVHWHGHHQRGTPYMDGVPHVTQCPVQPMSTFRYTFTADTPGTHFWHSHTGHQRADGAFGALVVRVPRAADPHAALWDRDERAHTLQVLDWGAEGGAERFLAHHHSTGPNKPTALLINGRGRVPPSPLPPSWRARPGDPPVPAPEFLVKQGLRYRFRLINAGFLNCPVEISIDDHDLLVISSDGSDIRPVAAASLVSYAGERFDFVVAANRSVGAYWIRMRGLLDCDDRFNAVHQAAVLRYEGASEAEPPGELSFAAAHRPGLQVNSFNVGTGTPGSAVIPELDAIAPDDESLKAEPDHRFYLAYDFYALDNPHFHTAPHYGFFNVTDPVQRTYTPQFNHISMKMPAAPMLSQRDQLDQRQFCNSSSMAGAGCERRYCECPHIIQVALNSVLEIILIDEGVTYDANHPFHLHGHAFRVVAMQRLGRTTTLEEVQRLDAQGLIARKLHAAPVKDTCTVPDGGFTILRVRASNPGYWLFHCHIEFHVEIGMALVFKIGDHSQFPPVPRGFPQCGDWVPEESDDEAAAMLENQERVAHKSGKESDNEDDNGGDSDSGKEHYNERSNEVVEITGNSEPLHEDRHTPSSAIRHNPLPVVCTLISLCAAVIGVL